MAELTKLSWMISNLHVDLDPSINKCAVGLPLWMCKEQLGRILSEFGDELCHGEYGVYLPIGNVGE